MGILRIGTEEVAHVVVQHRMLIQKLLVVLSFCCVGKHPFDQKVGNLDEVAVLDQILYVIASVSEDSLLAVDLAD